MTHPLLRSRQRGFTDEAINVNWPTWDSARRRGEYSNKRLLAYRLRDNGQKLGILGRLEPQVPISKIRDCADILTRFMVLPGTSCYFSGGCHAGREEHGRIYRGEKTRDFIDYHLEVLEWMGTLPHCDGFAYAPDLESHGDYDIEQKKAVQAEFVGAVRKVYPNLTVILTANGYGGTKDVLSYGAMPADNCILRWAFYDPFCFTHGHDRKLTAPLDYPATTEKVAASKGELPSGVKVEIDLALGYSRPQMLADWKAVKATGLPVLCQEAGVFRFGDNLKSAVRWHADVRSCSYSTGIPLMEFAVGMVDGRGTGFHLGVGLEPGGNNRDGRMVAGLS